MNGPSPNRVIPGAEEIPLPSWAPALARYLEAALDALGKTGWEVSLLLTGDRFVRELNLRYRGLDEPTDVLSFSQDGAFGQADGTASGEAPAPGGPAPFLAGDIVISLETLAQNAAWFGVSPGEELRRIAIHGILHLCGMDHATNGAEEPMLQLQERLLNTLDRGALPDNPADAPAEAEPPGARA